MFRGFYLTPAGQDPRRENNSPAVKSLAASLGTQGIVSLDGLTGTPRVVARLDDFLTEASLQPASEIALDYVTADADVFKTDASTLERARALQWSNW